MTQAMGGKLMEDRKRVLVIFAHPDDAEFSVGGTVALWARKGWEIYYLVLTDGSKGTSDPNLTPTQLAAIRREEQWAAARTLGVTRVDFLDYEDGALVPDLNLRRDIVRGIRKYRPDIVVCPDPTRRFAGRHYINHPDHIAAGEAALAAIYPSSRDRLSFPELLVEGLQPHKVAEVYLSNPQEPDTWIDIGDTIDVKIAALRQHRSQVGEDVEEWVRRRAREAAEGHAMEYAELFRYFQLG
jgi:LmbE family N-acetylglucosaminyl deacetylase